MHQQLENSQNSLTHYQNAIGEQRQKETLKLDSEHQRIQHVEMLLKNEVVALTQANAHLTAQKGHFEDQLSKITEQHNDLAQSQQATQKQFDQIEIKYDVLLPQHESLQKQNQKAEGALLAEKLKSERLSSQIEFQEKSLREKECQLQKSEDKLQQSEKKHAAALQEKAEITGQA
jgi:chromosome segregation ATPase